MTPGLSFEDVFLGLDIATKTGWAVVYGDVYRSGEVDLSGDRRLSCFRELITELIEYWRPAVVFSEDVFINPRPSTKTLLHLHGNLLQLMECIQSPHVYVNQAKAKSFIADHMFSSQQKKGGAMVRALRKHGYHVDGIEEADALAVALTGRHSLIGCGL